MRVLLLLALALPASAQPLEWRRRALPPSPRSSVGSLLAHDTSRDRTIVAQRAFDPPQGTWEWDGTGWALRAAETPRGVAMTFDAARGVTLLLEGPPLRDTWEWDGSAWTRRSPAHRPPGIEVSARLAYDGGRRRVVLVGSTYLPQPRTVTFEWDGSDWIDRAPAVSPPPRAGFGLAFDAARSRTVLFGGNSAPFADTWEWDGTAWTEVRPVLSPPAGAAVLAYDPTSRVVLAVAGTTPSTWAWDGTAWRSLEPASTPPERTVVAAATTRTRVRLFDTYRSNSLWEWDGTGWRLERPEPQPSLGAGRVVAHDSGRGRTMLQDHGENGRTDLWEWDGAVWERRVAGFAPAFMPGTTMAYDEARARAVMFGGLRGCGPQWWCSYWQETWEWDGSVWSLSPAPTVPRGRWRAAMTYDAWRRRVLLFGGDFYSIDFLHLGDLWEWDGTSWRPLPSGPPPRSQAGLAFDVARGRTVLFGGWNGTGLLSDTWEWDGTAWLQAFPAVTPAASGPMTWHTERQRVLLAAGDGSTWEWDGLDWSRLLESGPPQAWALVHDAARGRSVALAPDTTRTFADVWELAPTISVRGPGHPGGGLVIAWSAPPRVGQPFCVGFSLPPPQGGGWHLLLLAGAGLARPAALGPPAMCAPAWAHLAPQAVLVATGDPASFCLALPSNPALAGTLFTLQGASLALGACWLATDAVEAVVLP